MIKGNDIMKSLFKKVSFENKFGRKYYASYKNHSCIWKHDKARTRKEYKRFFKKELQVEIAQYLLDNEI